MLYPGIYLVVLKGVIDQFHRSRCDKNGDFEPDAGQWEIYFLKRIRETYKFPNRKMI